MIGIHVKFKIKEGEGDVLKFLDWKAREGRMQVKAQGFIKRQMTRDSENPFIFYYQSFWQSEEQMHAFSATQTFKDAMSQTDVTNAVEWREFSNVTEVFEDIGEDW